MLLRRYFFLTVQCRRLEALKILHGKLIPALHLFLQLLQYLLRLFVIPKRHQTAGDIRLRKQFRTLHLYSKLKAVPRHAYTLQKLLVHLLLGRHLSLLDAGYGDRVTDAFGQFFLRQPQYLSPRTDDIAKLLHIRHAIGNVPYPLLFFYGILFIYP